MLNLKLLSRLVAGPDQDILRYWDSERGSLEASAAVAVRAFMRGRRIVNVREGIRLFFALHPERLAMLACCLGRPDGRRADAFQAA
jgi:hypothetical protein